MAMADAIPTHPVAERLLKAGIKSAVVIDDAFDPLEVESLRTEIGDFWAGIVRQESALAELKGMKPDLVDEEDIDEELVNELWARTVKGELSSLSIPCRTLLFQRLLEGHADLESLVNNLSRIGITPILLGTGEELPGDALKLFFLDFFLGADPVPPGPVAVEQVIQQLVSGGAEHPSIAASMDKAREILAKFDDAYIVLMSSKDGVEDARDRFREATGLIEGMFDYASKDQLAREKDLYLKLGLSAAGLPVRHDIQRFISALETSVKEASEEFITRIKSLSVEDYSYVNSLSLRTEGHPLGDYMSWLYKSLLAHLVHNRDEVIEAQRKLDSIDIEKYVPLKRAPSLHLADIYRLALTEPGPTDVGHLRLGDLYIRDGLHVLLVINADCDLVYSYQSPSRPFNAELSIVLHPGRLAQVDEGTARETKVTNLFFLDGESYKIIWNHEGVITKKYGEVEDWLDAEGYVKKARLVAPHALEIQHHFAASLTRVGMPVAPPLPRPATVQVFGKNEDGTLEKLGGDISQGVVIDQDGFRFTADGFSEILERVAEGVTHYTVIRASFDSNHPRFERLGKNIERLESLLTDCAEWFAIVETSSAMPGVNGKQLGSNGIIQVFSTAHLETADCVIALNLISNGDNAEQTASDIGASGEG